MGIHTVKFIAEIQKRPCLWNNNLENYSGNKLAKQQAWDEVAQIMFADWLTMDATNKTEKLRQIQKKWKGLRDYFARARNNAPKNKDETDRRKRRKAPSLKMLQFLNITKPDDGVRPEPESEDSDSSYSSRSKSVKSQVFIETEQLITEVQNKPCIWNFSAVDYNEKDAKHQAWIEIAVALHEDFLSLSERNKREIVRHMQKKWKGLRDYFTRQKAKERATKGERPLRKRKAPFLAMLQFLDIPKPGDDESQDQGKSGSVTELNDNTLHEADSDGSRSSVTWSRNQSSLSKQSKNMPRSTVKKKSLMRKRDPDMNFLLNILPDMKSMNARQNFDFRFKVMKLIKNIKYNKPNDCYYSNASGSSTQGQEMPQFTWHTTSTDAKSGKPPFRHQVIIHEYPTNSDGVNVQSPLSNESAGSSVEDIKAILQESSDEQSD
ncbi:unnamed protein product [Arctia plantaginis]|uniref:MADF domain-containing protein n=1 Tax=Arctia plantaginis TaxID=874455 RepID=A0A8S1AII4_ARCPL|nr:unnamed protein product [Arctia plantaginis]